MDALLRPLAASYPSSEGEPTHPIDLPHTARLYKTLLQGGHFSRTQDAVERSARFDARSFAEAFVRIVGKKCTLAMAQGGGTFVVSELLERIKNEGGDAARAELKSWFDGFALENDENVKGWQVLVDKVNALRRKS
jgi:pumilio homology domain family member 6